MPSSTRTLTARAAQSIIDDLSFPETSARRVGVEIEWFTTPSEAPPAVRTLRRLLEPLLPLPSGSMITFEPGGQVELSSLPFDSSDVACRELAADAALVRAQLDRHGIDVFAAGIDPDRPLRLATDEQRYVAMKSHWDRLGDAGARMMCTSAAVHVNVDAGSDAIGRRRWHLAHQLGPVFVASFANSPLVDRRPSGWKSSRMAAWLAIDPTRAAPAASPVTNGADPRATWVSYALGANVMFIRTPDRFVPIFEQMPFGRWIAEGHELGFPTDDDLAYHLTTLFPPVRPHRRLELRMIDMVPDPWWQVAVALVTALIYDEDAGDRAERATRSTAGLWTEAAREGLDHPLLATAARECFDAAIRSLGSDDVEEYANRFVRRGRSPADERTEEYNQQIVEAI